MTLPLQFLMRTAAVLLTALLYCSCESNNTWMIVVASLGLGHYMLSLFYARPQIKRLFMNNDYARPLVVVIAIGLFAHAISFPLILFFMIHHVCNEVYSVNGIGSSVSGAECKRLQRAAAGLHIFFYLVVLQSQWPINQIYSGMLVFGTVVTAALFLHSLKKLSPFLTRTQLIEASGFEALVLALAIMSFWVKIPFLVIICYHFVLWCFLPLPRVLKRGRPAAINFLALTFACTLLFFLLSPLGFVSYPIPGSLFYQQFLFWSYVHIASSFAFSRSHPEWIVRWFWPTQPAQS